MNNIVNKNDGFGDGYGFWCGDGYGAANGSGYGDEF